MKFQSCFINSRTILSVLCGAVLAACGGGGGSAPTASPSIPTASQAPEPIPPTTAALTSTSSGGSLSALALAPVTDFRIENTDSQNAQLNVPFTLGQVFPPNTLQPGIMLTGRLDDGTTIPLQVDPKATHPGGSLRHAIISGVVPNLAAGAVRTISLMRSGGVQGPGLAGPDSLLSAGFNASVRLNIGGVEYSASAEQLLASAAPNAWLRGPVATEWLVSAPLTNAAGVAHPHLAARFAVRWFESIRKAKVDVTVENDWAYEPSPQNFKYDATVMVGGKAAYSKAGMNHLHHARWRKVFWWGGDAPQLNIKHNTQYLIASRALPNFDQSLTIPESVLSAMQTRWTGAITEPMAVGLANPYMPSTGGREDIGLLPGWAAVYLLSMDKRARDVTMGTADLAGSWSAHYRDKNTGRPVSLMNYPYMTLLGRYGDTFNPVTRKYEAFPTCAVGASCDTPNTHDNSHQPNFAYLPYLVTGDYYYLEELQFWAMWNVFSGNPGYRGNIKGLLMPEQVRGQAWGLRTLSEAAYITPDADPLKADFNTVLDSNLDWYNTTYSNNPDANKLGVVINGYSIVYNNSTGLAPWQDDFFTSAVGHTAELGYEKAKALLAWKVKFPIDRMTTPGTCWVDGSIYTLTVRPTDTSPLYTNFADAYRASHTADFNAMACASVEMAANLGLKVGEMTGYSDASMGYPSNMQPALAYGADAGGVAGKSAWTVFMGRSVKPDYRSSPEFAIVPR